MEATATRPRIESITVERIADESPDLSYLGDYTEKQPNCEEEFRIIDRQEQGDMGPHEFRYFVATHAAEDREHALQDYRRMEACNRGDWCMFGVRAKAETSRPIGQGCLRLQEFTSCGLWGIESDGIGGAITQYDYFRQIAGEELADLREHLEAYGVDLTIWDELAAAALDEFQA